MTSKKNSVEWTTAYRQLVTALMTFSQKFSSSAGTELYRLLKDDPDFSSQNIWLKRYETTGRPEIDPISIFASLNDSTLKEEPRTEKLNHYLRILGEKKIDSAVDYTGCPTPIVTRIIAPRDAEAQKEIWRLFRISQSYKRTLSKAIFTQVKRWYGVDIAAVTIFLFWVRPKFFLPLDKNTVQYLLVSGQISTHPKTYDDYMFILNLPLGDYVKFSTRVYRASHGLASISSEDPDDVDELKIKPPKRISQPHKVLAIRFDKKMEEFPNMLKSLKTERTYQFYQSYDFTDTEAIIYDPKKDISFYSQKNLKISISAIVGKNGAGKSTLTELIYAAINNLSKKHPSVKKKEIEYVKDVYLKIYYLSTFLHKIVVFGDEVRIYRYSTEGNKYLKPTEVDIKDFQLEEFFYTLAINYAHYGLNSNHLGSWLHHVFHKNDGYQMPITVSPYRNQGNIDINSEMELVRSRLLSLMLQPVNDLDILNSEGNLRMLKKGKIATTFKLTVADEKIKDLYQFVIGRKNSEDIWETKSLKSAKGYWKTVLKTVCSTFGIDPGRIPNIATKTRTIDYYAFAYIIKKLISITIKYPREWGDFFDVNQNLFNEHAKYISLLSKNYSHITFKLRQAINFLRYDHLSKYFTDENISNGARVSIADLSREVEGIISEGRTAFKTAYLVPPPFLSTEILFEDDSSFDLFSSGEKQRIYSVTTLVYHLMNLESVPIQKGINSYRCINVIFDEVELYFHPEMQRTFISFMLGYLKQAQFGETFSLNICFITHSPFILSDIPTNNILFLDDFTKGIGTFGANIHELLSSSFFLNDGFMGAYAQHVISDLAQYLSRSRKPCQIAWTKEMAENVIAIIGEPLIQIKLRELLNEKFKLKSSREDRIAELKLEILRLENEKNS